MAWGFMQALAAAHVITQQNNATVVNVSTFDKAGHRAPEPFFLAITCPKMR